MVFNPTPNASAVKLPEGEWSIYINGDKAGTQSLGNFSGMALAEPISAMVLVKAPAQAEDPQIIVDESEDTSIGIIGGADGPTAVLVSGNWGAMVAMTAAVICSLIAVIVALKNRKK